MACWSGSVPRPGPVQPSRPIALPSSHAASNSAALRMATPLARVRRSSLIGHIPFVVLKGGQCVMRRLVERARRRRRPEAVFGEVFLADLASHDLKVDPVLSSSVAQVVGGHIVVPILYASQHRAGRDTVKMARAAAMCTRPR